MMKATLFFLAMAASVQTMAFDKEDSRGYLKQAMMQANADYNEARQNSRTEENQRIVSWNERRDQRIEIVSDIIVEPQK